jgi:hypothetical protein
MNEPRPAPDRRLIAVEHFAANPGEPRNPDTTIPPRPAAVPPDAEWDDESWRWSAGAATSAGKRHGTWTHWGMNGARILESVHQDGRRISSVSYYPDGTVAARLETRPDGVTRHESFYADGTPWCSSLYRGEVGDAVGEHQVLEETLRGHDGALLHDVKNEWDDAGLVRHAEHGPDLHLRFENVRAPGGRELRFFGNGRVLEMSVRTVHGEERATATIHALGGRQIVIEGSDLGEETRRHDLESGGELGGRLFAETIATTPRPAAVSAFVADSPWAEEPAKGSSFERPSIASLLTALASPIPHVPSFAIHELVSALDDERVVETLRAIVALASPAGPRAIARIISTRELPLRGDTSLERFASNAFDAGVRLAALSAMASHHVPISMLEAALGDADLRIRWMAAVTAARVHGPDAKRNVHHVVCAVRDASKGVQKSLEVAVGEPLGRTLAEITSATGNASDDQDEGMIGAVTLPSGDLAIVDMDVGMKGQGPAHGSHGAAPVNVVAVYGLPRGRELPVIGRRDDAGAWAFISLLCKETGAVREEHIASLTLEEGRLMFADVKALRSWDHERSLDGLRDFVFFGGDDAGLAAQLHAGFAYPGSHECYGWADIPPGVVPPQIVGRVLAGAVTAEIRPHSSQRAILRRAWTSPHEAGTAEIGGAKMCGLSSSVGDGVFPVFLERDESGEICRVTVKITAAGGIGREHDPLEPARPHTVDPSATYDAAHAEWVLAPCNARGRLDGSLRRWRADGSLWQVETYLDGRLVNDRLFHPDGKLAFEGTFDPETLAPVSNTRCAATGNSDIPFARGLDPRIVTTRYSYDAHGYLDELVGWDEAGAEIERKKVNRSLDGRVEQTSYASLEEASREWNAKGQIFYEALNRFMETAPREDGRGGGEPKRPRDERRHMERYVLGALETLNAQGRSDDARRLFHPSFEPFSRPLWEGHGRTVRRVAALDDRLLVNVEDEVYAIRDDAIERVAGVMRFGASKNKLFLASCYADHVAITEAGTGHQVRRLDYPRSYGDIRNLAGGTLSSEPFRSPEELGIENVLVSNDGTFVVLATTSGIFLLRPERTPRMVLPTDQAVAAQMEKLGGEELRIVLRRPEAELRGDGVLVVSGHFAPYRPARVAYEIDDALVATKRPLGCPGDEPQHGTLERSLYHSNGADCLVSLGRDDERGQGHVYVGCGGSGAIAALDMTPDGKEIVVGTTYGAVWRLALADRRDEGLVTSMDVVDRRRYLFLRTFQPMVW